MPALTFLAALGLSLAIAVNAVVIAVAQAIAPVVG
jgi:hypothetical protein